MVVQKSTQTRVYSMESNRQDAASLYFIETLLLENRVGVQLVCYFPYYIPLFVYFSVPPSPLTLLIATCIMMIVHVYMGCL